ncbi:MAG: Flp family type IVb pilin [Hyphomicrobiales bacterium]|nr:Flp family type IVb pilin [Hyphomicrobiales bacterium]
MRKSLALLKRFAREDDGASMVEYAVLVGLISAALITAVIALSDQITTEFNEVTGQLGGIGG